jgi:hypothetical protein
LGHWFDPDGVAGHSWRVDYDRWSLTWVTE